MRIRLVPRQSSAWSSRLAVCEKPNPDRDLQTTNSVYYDHLPTYHRIASMASLGISFEPFALSHSAPRRPLMKTPVASLPRCMTTRHSLRRLRWVETSSLNRDSLSSCALAKMVYLVQSHVKCAILAKSCRPPPWHNSVVGPFCMQNKNRHARVVSAREDLTAETETDLGKQLRFMHN